MNKAYVILEKGFEYDDNIYNEQEGGNPSLIVFSKEDAKNKILELNINQFKKTSLTDYCYDMQDVLNVEIDEFDKFNESLVAKYGKIESNNKWESVENRLHPSADAEESKKFIDMVNITFFEVHETDIDTQSLREQQINSILN